MHGRRWWHSVMMAQGLPRGGAVMMCCFMGEGDLMALLCWRGLAVREERGGLARVMRNHGEGRPRPADEGDPGCGEAEEGGDHDIGVAVLVW